MMSESLFDSVEANYSFAEQHYGYDFSSHYTELTTLDSELEACFEETRTKLGRVYSLQECLDRDLGRELHLIQSVVGDDEHNTTDSYTYGPCIIGFGPMINGIKLSWKDTGISHYVGNYAEGWIITPPSADASFEVVNRRHNRNGVPFTLDTVKVKLLSPVRKQSQLWENDLESKIIHLAEIASWTDKSWFTYDFHQMSIILANAIFDFEDSRSFPFLFKTEGGCGGVPPYGNLDTVYSAMHYYTRGKSRRAIVGVMEEAIAVNLGSLSPKDTFFLRSSHLANMGDHVWLKYESAYRTLLERGELTASEANDLLAATEGTTLPADILTFGVEINPDNYVVGSSIAQLRKDGLLMSEIDVKVLLDSRKREQAVMGEKPIGILMNEIRESQVAFKSNHLKTLSEISGRDSTIRESLNARRLMLPDEPDTTFRDILYTYYRLRSESHALYSSFFYTDTIRVFKTSEISDYIGRSGNQVRADMAKTDTFPDWRRNFLEENSEERHRRTAVGDWFESAPLGDILSQPLPPGIGTDDARIARSVLQVVKDHNPNQMDAFAVILFSGDRQLARTTALLVRPYISTRLAVFSIDKSSYVAMCLDGLSESTDLQSLGKLHKGEPIRRIRQEGKKIMYYNYLLKRQWPMPEIVFNQMAELSGLKGMFKKKFKLLSHVEYDYPNMERGLDLLRYRPSTNSIEEYGGGFLERKTLQGFGRNSCWSKMTYETIKSWSDFDYVRSKRHYRRGRYLSGNHVVIVDPLSPATYAGVDQWRRNTFPGIAEQIDTVLPDGPILLSV